MNIFERIEKLKIKRSDDVLDEISFIAAEGSTEYADKVLELLTSDKTDAQVLAELAPLNAEYDTY